MTSMILNVTLKACIITGASNIMAQCIAAYRSGSPLAIDYLPVMQIMIYAALSTPPNLLWQQWIESLLPGQHLAPSQTGVDAASKSKSATPNLEKSVAAEDAPLVESRLNWPNTLLKLALDQTLSAGVNTMAYNMGMAGLKGADAAQAYKIAKHNFWPMISAGWKLWPAVQLANYALIKDVEMRALMGNLAGFAWNVYLSLMAGSL